MERKCASPTEAPNPRWVVPFPTLDSVGPNTADKRTRLSMRGDATVATIRDPGFSTSLSIMGRPKVHPANRLRANTACTTCRASKKRCSGSFPCTNCIRKGCGRTCIPFKSIPDTSPQSRPSPATQTAIEDIPAWSSSSVNLHSPAASHTHDGADRLIERVIETGSRSPEATHRTLPRMLRNLQGERGCSKCLKSDTIARLTFFYSLRWQGRFTFISSTPSRYGHSAYWTLAILP